MSDARDRTSSEVSGIEFEQRFFKGIVTTEAGEGRGLGGPLLMTGGRALAAAHQLRTSKPEHWVGCQITVVDDLGAGMLGQKIAD